MNSNDIRKLFLEYFRQRSHSIEKPASLIPENDPSLLFTGAGMNQFKGLFSGAREAPPKKAATCQRCFRATDIENVGRSPRHLTLLEMLGNFSFGDYFKEEAAALAWEFLLEKLQIPEHILLVTVFEEDEESWKIWNEKMGVEASKIFRLGAGDNFWEMGKTGPCGPCSEILVDRGEFFGCGRASCGPACGCDRHMELWNLVFMQFNRTETGTLEPLPRRNIDTGMGLERAACAVQEAPTVFETDLLKPLAIKAGEISLADASACRIIADHARACVFLIADGVSPANEGRGYVLRKLIRRILEKARKGKNENVFQELVETVCALMKNFYPYLEKQSPHIQRVLEEEASKFSGVFDRLPELEEKIEKLKTCGEKFLPGSDYFMFYDTYGIPRDTIRERAEEGGLIADEAGFESALEKQRSRSRTSSAFSHGGPALSFGKTPTEFTGYTETETRSTVAAVIEEGGEKKSAEKNSECCLITKKSPFYPESGGQKGDSGIIRGEGWVFNASDTKKTDGAIIHCGRVIEGSVKTGEECVLSVDKIARLSTASNHTATHLLQHALKKMLGSHVRQAGSFVGPEGLRFDFTHSSRLGEEEIAGIEKIVNGIIRENIAVETETIPLESALEAGALTLPGEEYGEFVRVVKSGGYSMELCGGTHARSTGNLGFFLIVAESSIASGIRRIEALTGNKAEEHARRERTLLRRVSSILKTSPAELPSRAEALLKACRELEKQACDSRKAGMAADMDKILAKAENIGGVQVLVHKEAGAPPGGLEALADSIRKKLPSSVCVLASPENGKVHIVASASAEAVAMGINAGKIARETAEIVGGGGGGRADFAKAGGKNPAKLDDALAAIPSIIKKQIKS